MKKIEQMRTEYRRKELGKGVRGRHYAEFRKGTNMVAAEAGAGKKGSPRMKR